MNLTAAQQQAVDARGNILVMAGAGTGKTRTLVERCLQCLLRAAPRASLDEILVVTFTEAAAAEMRQRLRARLEEESATDPADLHWQEQMALFETAHIGTLHSFCYKLVRQHFYELELDPQVSVLPEEEARLLAEETLDALLRKNYEGNAPDAEAVQHLIQTQAKGSDMPIRGLVLKLHHYTQTLPAPAAWFARQLEMFASPEPEVWRAWFLAAVTDWVQRCSAVFQAHAPRNEVAAACHAALAAVTRPVQLPVAVKAVHNVNSAAQACRKKSAWVTPLQPFISEAAFLGSLAGAEAATDPLLDDWNWVRQPMSTLLRLAQEFGAAFAHAKRELGVVDFHDLEQHTLRLLWDSKSDAPTAIAKHWRRQLRFVLVDEYQDINAAQDKILQALSREARESNRFLVGDIKQSIYRFRLANPRIFQGYALSWGQPSEPRPDGQIGTEPGGQVIPLVENFRSRRGILSCINSVFEATMRRESGGVEYDESARLVSGAPDQRQPMAELVDSPPPVELHLRIKATPEPEGETSEALEEISELEEAAKEARLVALRLRELKAERHPVWDEKLKQLRPVDWADMAILLRAPSGKIESFAKEFARLGVPLQANRGGFYNSSEVSDLVSLLQLLDNPLQDLPAVAVLRSPLVGLSLDELATIRLVGLKAPFWSALVRWHESHGKDSAQRAGDRQAAPVSISELHQKLDLFLSRFNRWRRLARQSSLSHCLETILAEIHYTTWLRFQPRGEQRRANIQRLLGLAQRFDQLQRQGLFRFLRFIDAQQRAGTEPEVASVASENAVRLLSIHQSKGLEFPVVVAADLAKSFNMLDLRAEMILDEEFGLCPQVTPPRIRKRYPSLAHWLAARRQKRELLGEELRLLYVAMTRARDLLILTCSLSQKSYGEAWRPGGEPLDPGEARSCADWLALGLNRFAPRQDESGRPETVLLQHATGDCHLRWFVHNDSNLIDPVSAPALGAAEPPKDFIIPEVDWKEIRQRLSWQYAFAEATRQPAKTTVSALRRASSDSEFQPSASGFSSLDSPRTVGPLKRAVLRSSDLGLDAGTAHHTFLEFVSLEKTGTAALLREEVQRLKEQGMLTAAQAELLDLDALAVFWGSSLGGSIREQRDFVHRELPFTFRLSPEELGHFTGQVAQSDPHQRTIAAALPREEFIIVQGVADLVVILPLEIWLLDFKTDKVPGNVEPHANKYAPQLKLYAKALTLIYKRPVTQCWLWFLGAGRGVAVEPR